MRNVLYEAAFKFDFALFIPVVMMIFILALPKIWKKSREEKYTIITYKAVKIFCACGFIFVLFLTLILGYFSVHMYKNIVGAYKAGDYEIVEGYVDNFAPVSDLGRSGETFEIDGVQFSYSDYDVQFGYNKSKSNGGVIEGNGQHLKIGYVIYNDMNIIVYIEQLE